ncbi:hypothetical protein H6769_04110 [Candidatus Peribacteria bacterium]|nr:hypothetical protein [Candidatus Peribacteria bacterium]
MEHTVSRLNDILSKECPEFDFDWETFRDLIMICFVVYYVCVIWWIIMQLVHPSPAGSIDDMHVFGWLFILCIVLPILVHIIYALRHILLWIAGILIILGLISALVSAPSCSALSVTTATPEKVTEHCRFYEACFWKGTSVHLPTFSFPSYCWFWEECYPGNNQESSGSPAPIVVPSATIPEDTTQYCWFWDNCFWQQLFGSNDSVVLKPEVIEPVKAVEAKVSPPEFTEHVIQRGDTLWKLAGGDLDQVEAIALLNAGVLDPYWIKNCHHISKKTNKWCAEPKHTLQIGMRIFIPIRK